MYDIFFPADLDAFAPAFCLSCRGFKGFLALSGGSALSMSRVVGTFDEHFCSLRFFSASLRLLTFAIANFASNGNPRRFSPSNVSGTCSSAEHFLALSCSSFETRATLASRAAFLIQ